MDTFIQTTDFILFLCFSLMTVYLGVLAIAASLRNDTPYPQAGKDIDSPFWFPRVALPSPYPIIRKSYIKYSFMKI